MHQRAGARIVAEDWGYRYPGRRQPALIGVSFEVPPGALVVLMGASGSGKSTLLSALAGSLPEGESQGSLRVETGEPAAGPLRRGLVQQEPEGNLVMEQVGDDVAFVLECAAVPRERIWPAVSGALGSVGLDVALAARTDRLSGGQQQLLALAAATVAGPPLLLLDEPTANLDPTAAEAVLDAVDSVRQRTGCTVVVVEHRVEPWLARADAVLLAAGGTVRGLSVPSLDALLAADPALAARAWLGHSDLVRRPPMRAVGPERLVAGSVGVTGRLAPIDLTVAAGEVVALTGPPGSGKSTLLACLGGLLEPDAGSVQVTRPGSDQAPLRHDTSADPPGGADVLQRSGSGVGEEPYRGRSPATDPWRWRSVDVAETFGIVFQNPEHQFLTSRVADELRHGLDDSASAADRVAAMLDRLHLAHLAEADPFTLSGGEQRRLSVGTALVRAPVILLLDEPTFGQDPTTWAEVVQIVAAHRDAGGAVVLATHDPHLVEALAARGVRLVPVPPAGSTRVSGRSGATDLDEAGSGRLEPGSDRDLGAVGLRGLDPLALLAAAALCSVAALISTSVTFNFGLAGLALAAALLGRLGARRTGLLALPALVATASVGLSNVLLSDAGITRSEAWTAAALPASRVLAVALPGLVAAIAIDPTALADALTVRLRVPARAAYSVLAGLRLLPLLADEWRTLGRASRARGLDDRGVRGRARWFTSTTFRLLVAALRRGGRLAIALDVRGLRSDTPRTVARPVRWHWWDSAALLVGAAALALAIATRS